MDHPLRGVRAVLGGRIYTLGDVPAGQNKSFPVKAGGGASISDMAQPFGQQFRSAVQAINSSFGNNANYITDVAQAAAAASFLSYANASRQETWNNFSGPSNLDLSRFAGEHYAILLAWDAGHSPTALNQFTAKRTHRDTLFRLVVPMKM
jgi:hypothetical protein